MLVDMYHAINDSTSKVLRKSVGFFNLTIDMSDKNKIKWGITNSIHDDMNLEFVTPNDYESFNKIYPSIILKDVLDVIRSYYDVKEGRMPVERLHMYEVYSIIEAAELISFINGNDNFGIILATTFDALMEHWTNPNSVVLDFHIEQESENEGENNAL